MASFRPLHSRRRQIELEKARAAAKMPAFAPGLPVRLTGCDDLLADAADSEATYFRRFVLLKSKGKKKRKGGLAGVSPWYAPFKDKVVRSQVEKAAKEWAQRFKEVLPPRDGAPAPGGGGIRNPGGGRGPRPSGGFVMPQDGRPLFGVVPVVAVPAPRRSASQPRRIVRHGSVATPTPPKFGNGFDLTPLFDLVQGFFGAVGYGGKNQPCCPGPKSLWAIGIEFEQVWDCEGYRRGRLVRSIPLTPGERLDVEIKSWDRQTVKKSLVESIEQHLSTEITGEEKWSLATKMNFVNQTNASVNPSAGANADVGIPIDVVDLDLGGDLGINGSVAGASTHSGETGTEFIQSATIKSALSLKSIRTNSVEITRETGIETTTKQAISNPNKCHSLAYHYFEVVEDYRVTTSPVDANLYLLIELPVPTLELIRSPAWILAHECILKRVLPCDTFYAGFEAAKKLAAQDYLPETPAYGVGVGGGTGATGTPSALAPLVDAVLAGYRTLSEAGLIGAPQEGAADPLTVLLDMGGAVVDAIVDFGKEVGGKIQEGVEAAEDLAEDTCTTISETVGDGVDAVVGFFGGLLGGQARMAAPHARAVFSGAPSNPSGGPGSFVYWRIVEIVAPEIASSLEFLATSWPATQTIAGDRDRALAEINTLASFFAQLGDPRATFGKVDAAISTVSAIALGAPIAIGAAVYGVGGAIAGGILGALPTVGLGAGPGAAIGGAVGAAGGAAVGAMVSGAIAGLAALVGSLESFGLVDTIPDDEGLKASVTALKAAFDSANVNLPFSGALGSPSAGDGTGGPSAIDLALQRAQAEASALAEAHVEFERLADHIGERLFFYAQALWSDLRDYDIECLVRAHGIPTDVVEMTFSGFIGCRGALRVRDLGWVKKEAEFDFELERKKLSQIPPSPAELITLPTPGMVVEPARGRCNGCDEFVQTHRTLDLENRRAEVEITRAKADQERAEADRFEERVRAGELSDPTPFEGPATTVRVNPDNP